MATLLPTEEVMLKGRFAHSAALVLAILGVALIATATPAQAVTFDLTSCHISTGCPAAGTVFGTVTLTQVGTGVLFDVVLNNGNRFVETGAGGDSLFLFNDSIAGSTVTGITATLDGANVAITGGLSGLTNQPPIMADGTGTFTAQVFCTNPASCNGGSTPNINDLHFTVTNATIDQLDNANAAGNIFVADILCGASVTGCAGFTGPVDVTGGPGVVPEPTTLLLVGTALAGLGGAWRRRRSQRALAV
jgi:PEP-CTERM motif